ncbi:MAG: hypothetical protein J5603_02995 [Bacteroidales bacterium]|nr:hypothetical protein [Bacteroidales bacterium]MBR5652306.1 hypothetical protein [Bacteroidales bacterium]MBR5720589.1 hypothetical protein [Bacteroidales bacterium]
MAKSKKSEDQIENTTETGVQEETPKKKTVKKTAKTKEIEPEGTTVAEENLETKKKTASSRTKAAASKTASKVKDAETEQAPEKPAKRTRSKKADRAEEESNESQVIMGEAVVIDNSGHSHSVVTESDVSIEKKLESLFKLQVIDSKIDDIRIVRGELPLEVQDLEDEIAGLETRISNYKAEIKTDQTFIKEQEIKKSNSQELIKKYDEQRNNVRNNREYDSLTKEIQFQELEIVLCDKKIREATAKIEHLNGNIEVSTNDLADRKDVLSVKKSELDGIIQETENEELKLVETSKECKKYIEERLLTAYDRIRKSVRNGLAVVQVERDACAGCFNKIPPQRQLDIKMRKKIIVCEFCGRILVDDEMANRVKAEVGITE